MQNDNETPIEAAAEQSAGSAVDGISRRDAVSLLAALPVAALLKLSGAEHDRVWRHVEQALRASEAGAPLAPKFFTPAEFRTVRVLADMIIPRDEQSGSASDAGVPEFIDFTVSDRAYYQKPIRDGLAWLDAQSTSRFGKSFVDAAQSQREAILNDIAWPGRAPASMADGVRFFNSFRDLTASGFWSSEVGVKDLRYMGNVFVMDWKGCPPAALHKLGVDYSKFDRSKLKLTPDSH
ncbi:MAG TPA: gluconate 2-dehydrogenase subunit 3 family protein [Gemmatimonadaceae bacterium]|jgi:gluconate 2-dehydrogenase gamma chain|nr:gluconate 2-dehydrogenase subunit 3 family protein [Gemmatimonadaceae bacterium]